MQNFPPINIIRSFRKTLSLHISSKGELIVKAPFFIPEKIIQDFINQKEDWVLRSLQKVKNSKLFQKTYQEGEEFLYLGDVYKFHLGDFKEISFKNGLLNFPLFMKFRAKKELTSWYIKSAQQEITSLVKHFSLKMNTEYKSIRFSDTSSKWGSCGRDNSLQFNWRLIMAPLLVINYVVIHELSHTTEKNHGSKFWNKVDLYTPSYKQQRKWLKKNHHLLSI